jgi:hypothetical protein
MEMKSRLLMLTDTPLTFVTFCYGVRPSWLCLPVIKRCTWTKTKFSKLSIVVYLSLSDAQGYRMSLQVCVCAFSSVIEDDLHFCLKPHDSILCAGFDSNRCTLTYFCVSGLVNSRDSFCDMHARCDTVRSFVSS